MKKIKYIFICALFMTAVSCNVKKDSMGPEAVVETFCRTVASGDIQAARALCDTLSMNDYLDNYQKAMDSLQKEDSCAFAIARSILEGAEFEVTGTDKKGEERIILYRLAAEGYEKVKKATLTKEEGEWRITAITDAE